MIADDFIFHLTTKYKDNKNRGRNFVFKEELLAFVDKCPENRLQEMYDYIPTFHKWSTPFDVWKLVDFATEQGYIKKYIKKKDYILYYKCKGFTQLRIETLENGYKKKHYDHIKCNTAYSFGSTGCPNCHSTNSEMIKHSGESLPENVLIVKEDCHKCKNYDLSHVVNLENNVHGPECDKYGRHEYPNSDCGDCKCKVCCEEFKLYTESPREYTDNIKRTGTDTMYWISKNMVVSMHIRDERRLTAPERKGQEHSKPSFFGVNIEELAKSKRVDWSNSK
jgi:hypothetical protein